jgi:hypothetical protein
MEFGGTGYRRVRWLLAIGYWLLAIGCFFYVAIRFSGFQSLKFVRLFSHKYGKRQNVTCPKTFFEKNFSVVTFPVFPYL